MLLIDGITSALFGAGLVPFCKTYWAEQFPTHLKGLGIGLSEFASRTFAGILTAFFVPFIFASGGVTGVFWMVTATFLVCLGPFLIWGRETAGLSMEEASQFSTMEEGSEGSGKNEVSV